MRNQKGFIPIALAIVIGAIALGLVGVSVYYKVATDKDAHNVNTNQVAVNTNAATNVNTDSGLISQTCANTIVYSLVAATKEQASVDCQSRQGTLNECDSTACGSITTVCKLTCTTSNTNANVVVNTNITNQNANTNAATNVNTNTATNTNTVTSPYSSAGCPVWPTYTDVEYNWTARYPCNWTAERVYEASGEDMFDYPTRYTIFRDPTLHYRLLVGIMPQGGTGSTINRTGVGAGDFVNQAAIQVAGVSVPVRNLEYQSKVKEVFFYQGGAVNLGGYLLTSTFDEDQDLADYDDIQLSGTDELVIGKTILQSINLP